MTYNSINMNILIKSCLTLGLLLSVVGGQAQVIKKSDSNDGKMPVTQVVKFPTAVNRGTM